MAQMAAAEVVRWILENSDEDDRQDDNDDLGKTLETDEVREKSLDTLLYRTTATVHQTTHTLLGFRTHVSRE
jgi:hypothetical protein